MFDIGWSEFLVIGIVALVVIGPKELPGVLRTVGKSVGKLRRMAGEFQGQFQEALREADLADLKKDLTGFADDTKKSLTGFVDDTKNSISGALPTNPLLDIENDLKAPTTGVERADLPSADPVQAMLPEPSELEPNAFETIEEEVRNAAAKLDVPESIPDATPAAKPVAGSATVAASAPVAAAATTAASATPAAATPKSLEASVTSAVAASAPVAATSATPAAPVQENPVPAKRVRRAAAKPETASEAAPEKPTRVRKPKTVVEPEIAEAVAALDGPAPTPKKRPPVRKAAASPRIATRPKAPSTDKGPAE